MKRIGILLIALFLTGCSARPRQRDGFFNDYFVQPFAQAIQGVAGIVGDNYGVAIIVITIAMRLILMPLMLNMYKKQQVMKQKMAKIKPEMDDVQNRMKESKTQEEKQEIQKEMMALYQKHGVNPLNMGCLPLILQMPIVMGFYYAIRGSQEIASHSFLWYPLGEMDIFMAFIAAVIYYVQYRVSMNNMPIEQQGQMKIMGLLSPGIILFISLSAPAALPLYWAVSGLFLIFQTWIGQKLYKPVEE